MPMVFFPRGIYECSLFLGFCNRLDGTGQGPGAHIYKKRKGYGIEFVLAGPLEPERLFPITLPSFHVNPEKTANFANAATKNLTFLPNTHFVCNILLKRRFFAVALWLWPSAAHAEPKDAGSNPAAVAAFVTQFEKRELSRVELLAHAKGDSPAKIPVGRTILRV